MDWSLASPRHINSRMSFIEIPDRYIDTRKNTQQHDRNNKPFSVPAHGQHTLLPSTSSIIIWSSCFELVLFSRIRNAVDAHVALSCLYSNCEP